MKRRSSRLRYWLNLTAMTALSLALTFFILTLYASNRWAQTHRHPPRNIATGALLMENEILYKEIELKTVDGINLSAWYTPPQNGAVILVAHGYSGARPEAIYVMLAKNGYGVLAWDARAHGESGGQEGVTLTIGEMPSHRHAARADAEAESCAEYLAKGRSVLVDGHLQQRSWETPEGQKRNKHEVVAERVQFLGPRKGTAGPAGTEEEAEPPRGPEHEDVPF